ncbi:MAG: BMP family ABC transporter substrate-binding protein [Acidimicrobiaceae bacterium]|nr:BMP family ABC transporter substrate-binding protein [Acidimicrobiaceae bacterium]MYE09472.1 BMP family ABC transporter substrate-binding protein [Acidimicrobiaceae bacterium]
MRKIRLGLVVLIAFALVAAACGDDEAEEEVAATTTAAPATTAAPTTEAPAEPLRIAFMYDGEIDDGGWNEAHENGRQYLIANMDGIETTFVENLSPGSEFQAAFEDFGSQGYDLVICTTWCQDDVLVVAPNYPDTVYLSWGGYQTAPNVGHFDGATEDGRYLDGLVAGSQPGVELIGYVGGFAIEEVVRGVNAFMIGAREINPDIETQVVWVNSWYDPAAEQQAAQALVDAGADLLAAEVNAPAVASVAEASGIGYIHYGIDGSGLAPNSWLSGFTFNWGPYYLSQAQALADGTWEPALSYGGLRDGVVGMSPFGDAVTAETIALVEQRRQEIVDGTFDYFAGPITDNQGNVVIAEGATVPWEERTLCCQWLIEGVIGEIPAG